MKTIIKNKNFSASINLLGAELEFFKKENTNYIWTIDKQYWDKTSPVLFPIVGKLKDDTYVYKNKTYHLSRHGFARNFEFKVKEHTLDSVAFSLIQNEATLLVFPFSFELEIKYALVENKLIISYHIYNHSNDEMPFNIGAHPAFAIDELFENYSLQFSNDEVFETHHLENDLFNGKTSVVTRKKNVIKLNYDLFKNDALVFKNLNSKAVFLCKKDIPFLKVNFDGFPFLGIWTKAHAPFICIEPWMGHADFNDATGLIFDKKNIQTLKGSENFNCSFSLEII